MNLQPVTKTDEGFFNTVTGIKINILAPTVEMISIVDIAAALSKICRFGGHTPRFYSVAQHSLFVEYLSPEPHKRTALLHDCSEAYVGDMIKPLKHIVGKAYDEVEDRFMKVIFEKFGVDIALLPEIKQWDTAALIVEHDYFWGKTTALEYYMKVCMGHNTSISAEWNSAYAENAFIERFTELFI